MIKVIRINNDDAIDRSRSNLRFPGSESGVQVDKSDLRRWIVADSEVKREKVHGIFPNQAKGMVT